MDWRNAAKRFEVRCGGVPRYFFHIHDDIISTDPEGIELADLEAARACAVEGARSLMMAQVQAGKLDLDHWIEVADEQGREVFRLRFAEALTVRGGAQT